jgi:hypothetical protein
MADFNIPAGTTQTDSFATNSTNTVEGNSTAAYGTGGGTLNTTSALPGHCTVTATGAILDIDGVSNNDTFTLNNSTLDLTGGSWNSSTVINFGTGDSGVIVPPSDATSPNLGGVQFTGFNSGDYISTGSTSPITNVSWSGGTLNFTQNGINYGVAMTLASGVSPNFTVGTENGQPVIVDNSVVCFAAGALIRSARGDVPIEDLKVSDLVVVSSGEHRPVKWAGHKTFDLRGLPKTHPARPIRIAADAIGPGQPSHALYVSAPHSVCVDLCGETLIPVEYLVNGATIARCEVDEITYWHVELDSHDIIFANGLRAESYLAMGNRGAFDGEALAAFSEGRDKTHADFCRPVLTGGPVLEFVRQRLLARAEEIGWTATRDPDLRLIVDGRVIRPTIEEGAAGFLFPASAREVHLASTTFTPTTFGKSDRRCLGVAVFGLSFSGSLGGEPRRVRVDDERLRDGFHAIEGQGSRLWRWTTGEGVLNPQLWDGLSGQIALLLTYGQHAIRGWSAPAGKTAEAAATQKPKLYVIQ